MNIAPLHSNHLRVFDQNFKKKSKKLLPMDQMLPQIGYIKDYSDQGEIVSIDMTMTPQRVTNLATTLVEQYGP